MASGMLLGSLGPVALGPHFGNFSFPFVWVPYVLGFFRVCV